MTRRLALAGALVWGLALGEAATRPVSAQEPFRAGLVPKTTALRAAGLERRWMISIPLLGSERVIGVSLAEDMLFAQTSAGELFAFDAETGAPRWGGAPVQIGGRTELALPVSVNAERVFVANSNGLFVFDRKYGRPIKSLLLDALPSSGTAADGKRVVVGLGNGKLMAFHADTLYPAWNEKTAGRIDAEPIVLDRVVVAASYDSRVYVLENIDRSPQALFRFRTAGPISASLAYYGSTAFPAAGKDLSLFTILAGSEDHNLYAIDLYRGTTRWVYATGAPIRHQPLVAGDQVYVLNAAGMLSHLDLKSLWSVDDNHGVSVARFAETRRAEADAHSIELTNSTRETHQVQARPIWVTSTGARRILAIGPKHIYLTNDDNALSILDRKTGALIATPAAVLDRYAIDTRPFLLAFTNERNDRMYWTSPSGLMVCVSEAGVSRPVPLRDPNAPPFGFVPNETPEEGAAAPPQPMPDGPDANPQNPPQ